MSKSSKTNSTSTSAGTTNLTQTPTNPAWVDQGIAGFGSNITKLAGQDPFSFYAGPDALQTQAGAGAAGLTSSPGFGQAAGIANGVAGAPTPSIASHLGEFQNPYTDQVVNTTLHGFDQNAGYSRARDMLARGGDTTFGGSGGDESQTALNEQNIAQGRAQTEAQLRNQGFETALGGASSQAGLDSQSLAQHLAAAGLLSGNASAQGQDARANIDTQSGIGGILQQLAQTRASQPLAVQGALSSMFAGLPLSLLHGQTANGTESTHSTGTSNTTVSDPLGSLGGILAGAGSLASGLGSMGLTFSDRRLKWDIQKIGEMTNGLGLYFFRYLWSPRQHVGVMAQEVQKVKPEAVLTHPSGFLMVDYGKL